MCTLPERSWYILGRKSRIRRWTVLAVKSKLFERLVLLVILGNCVALAMDSQRPGFDTTPGYSRLQAWPPAANQVLCSTKLSRQRVPGGCSLQQDKDIVACLAACKVASLVILGDAVWLCNSRPWVCSCLGTLPCMPLVVCKLPNIWD